MLNDSLIGLSIGVIVISSVAWVSQWRKIMNRIKLNRAIRAQRQAGINTLDLPR